MTRRIVVLLALAVAAAGAALEAAPLRGGEPTATTLDTERLTCLTPRRIARVRADPDHLAQVYRRCRPELVRKIPFARPGLQRRAALASLVAYAMAPYGPSKAMALAPLLSASTMNCGNYGWMTFHLVRRAWGERQALRLWQAGWDHGAVGNHAQVHVGDLLLDPTIGVVARVRYEQILDGRPVSRLVAFAHRDDIHEFALRVVDALRHGRYRPADVLYRQDYANWRDFR
jgi:hypothetical protein